MSLFGKRLSVFRFLAVLGFLVVLPFAADLQKVAAAPMDHMGGGMHESCASACAQLNSNAPQVAMVDSARLPDPEPRLLEPFADQPLQTYVPRVLRPAQSFSARPIRPPNIVALTTNYRS